MRRIAGRKTLENLFEPRYGRNISAMHWEYRLKTVTDIKALAIAFTACRDHDELVERATDVLALWEKESQSADV